MRNLLTPKIKQRVLREYRLRLVTAVLILLSIVLLLAIISLLPSYIFLKINVQTAEKQSQLVEQGLEQQQVQSFSDALRTTQLQLSLLASIQKDIPFSQRVRTIIENKSQGVEIISFAYTTGDNAESSLTLSGKARTRAHLIAFERSLKSQPDFDSVILPVSNLAQDRDISFSLTIKGTF